MDLKALFQRRITIYKQGQDSDQAMLFYASLGHIICFDYIRDTYPKFLESADSTLFYLDNLTSGSGHFFYRDAAAQTNKN